MRLFFPDLGALHRYTLELDRRRKISPATIALAVVN
jgi:hypothetical protein